ncbi:MAG: hypothetical protein PVH00_15215, partial [Gemmatimonadota bacterium]
MRTPQRTALLAAALLLAVSATGASAVGAKTGSRGEHRADWSIIPIPSYSRQTKLPCNVCHTTFPQLTEFGRQFKLNGYTLTGAEKVTAKAASERETLSLDLIPPVSVMLIGSSTTTAKRQPGTQNGSIEFPDEMSLFVGEAITPHLGTFLQFTYAAADGSFGMDNADIRYSNHASLGSRPLAWGLTLNNNPGVQDVWNTVPAWGFPYKASELAPGPAAGVMLDGGLEQSVAGLGAYAFFDNTLYAEFSAYRSAFQGGPHPPDSTAEGALSGTAPYWRAAVARTWGPNSIEVGTMGLSARLFPTGVAGPTDRYTDVGADLQYQRSTGSGFLTAHGLWVHEKQHLTASYVAEDAENLENTLQLFRADASYHLSDGLGATAGAFATTGTKDAALYAPDPVFGSRTGEPDSRGLIAQLEFMPWLNTRFTLQETMYTRFNGASTSYDGSG